MPIRGSSKWGKLVHRAELQLLSIFEDLPQAYGAFYNSAPEARTCPACGEVQPGRDWQAWQATRALQAQ